MKKEAAVLPHLLYPQILDDDNPTQRTVGMHLGQSVGRFCKKIVVYTDYGKSEGMKADIEAMKALGKRIVYRFIGKNRYG